MNTKKNKVVGEIIGGLGNQLFIIFTTYSHALDNDSEAYIKLIEKKRKSYFDTPLYKNIKRTDNSLRVFREKWSFFYKDPRNNKHNTLWLFSELEILSS